MKTTDMKKANCHDLREKVTAFIKRHSLIEEGDSVLVGLSGGPDSVCLLDLLSDLKEDLRLTLHAVYVNHNLRPDEVPGEIKFCRDLCGKLSVNFVVRSIDVKSYISERGMNKQEGARDLRYAAFEETAREVGATKIALAHNADDQVETLIMRLLRGSGPKGLSGIPAKRGKIIRPLIETGRGEIECFMRARNIPSVVDSSNLGSDYVRNRIRHEIIPVLRRLNPNLAATLLNTASIFQEEERYLDIIVTKALMKLISRKKQGRIELFLSPLETLDTVILRRALRRAIDATEGLRGVQFRHIEEIIGLIRKGRSGDRLYLPKGIRAIRDYALLVLTSEPPVTVSDHELQPPVRLALAGTGIVIDASFEEDAGETGDGKTSALFDAGTMHFPLTVRSRRPGDFFFPFGFGKRKKLQDFFVDEKVPRDERDAVPLVLSGNDIIWVGGYRTDERFKVKERTGKFLRLALLKGNF